MAVIGVVTPSIVRSTLSLAAKPAPETDTMPPRVLVGGVTVSVGAATTVGVAAGAVAAGAALTPVAAPAGRAAKALSTSRLTRSAGRATPSRFNTVYIIRSSYESCVVRRHRDLYVAARRALGTHRGDAVDGRAAGVAI